MNNRNEPAGAWELFFASLLFALGIFTVAELSLNWGNYWPAVIALGILVSPFAINLAIKALDAKKPEHDLQQLADDITESSRRAARVRHG